MNPRELRLRTRIDTLQQRIDTLEELLTHCASFEIVYSRPLTNLEKQRPLLRHEDAA